MNWHLTDYGTVHVYNWSCLKGTICFRDIISVQNEKTNVWPMRHFSIPYFSSIKLLPSVRQLRFDLPLTNRKKTEAMFCAVDLIKVQSLFRFLTKMENRPNALHFQCYLVNPTYRKLYLYLWKFIIYLLLKVWFNIYIYVIFV